MFVEDNELIDLKVYFKKVDKRTYVAHTEGEFADLELSDDLQKTFKSLSVKMKELSWGLYNDLQEQAVEENPITGGRHFNYKLYKENRLKRLLVDWNAVDAQDQKIPVNEAKIMHLAPPIAEAILRAYDEESFLTEEEEKN